MGLKDKLISGRHRKVVEFVATELGDEAEPTAVLPMLQTANPPRIHNGDAEALVGGPGGVSPT